MIDSKDVCVVFCGEFPTEEKELEGFKECLKRTREELPESFFILSCGELTKVPDDMKYDLVVRSKSPAELKLPVDVFPRATKGYGYNWHYKKNEMILNHNRMITKAKTGVNAVPSTFKYILRLRTDMFINNADFLNLFELYQARREEKYNVFKNRVLLSSLFTINCKKWECYIYHPSDWLNFGLREDVKYMWNIHISDPIRNVKDPYFRDLIDGKLIPEVYCWMSVLNKKFGLFPEYLAELNPKKEKALAELKGFDKKKKVSKSHPLLEGNPVETSHKFMYNNFIPIDASPINFYSIKKQANWLSHNSIYSFGAFLNDYLNFGD